MPQGKFYITTTLPYVNADPHIGFAAEVVRADILARFHRLLGDEVFSNTGTDEHGDKIYRAAQRASQSAQEFVDEKVEKFKDLKKVLNLSYDRFIRTTDPEHIAAAQEFWKKCEANGDIYKKIYPVKYCVGCELEKTEGELEDGKCPVHPNLEIEIREEENYFFKFSKYQQPLLNFYNAHPDFVIPDFRFNEIKSFVKTGLNDFSISRLREKMPWGIAVPGDSDHVMYVWFDALVNYIVPGWWPAVQIAGKDNLRQQSAMWQAMLMSAGLPNSRHILINGFIISGGQKMSKSLGNVIDPFELVRQWGTDAVRYYLTRELNQFEDSDFTSEKFKEAYNASLANGLGNLVSRIMKMAISYNVDYEVKESELPREVATHLNNFEIKKAADHIWGLIQNLDAFIQKTEPFKKIKTNEQEAKEDIKVMVTELHQIAHALTPFLPETSEKIKSSIINHQLPPILFPRK